MSEHVALMIAYVAALVRGAGARAVARGGMSISISDVAAAAAAGAGAEVDAGAMETAEGVVAAMSPRDAHDLERGIDRLRRRSARIAAGKGAGSGRVGKKREHAMA